MKTFVLDTNVIIHDPNAIFAFEESKVVIPLPVIEELDHFKRESGERGRAARLVARRLDEFRAKGKLINGVWLDNGSELRVAMVEANGTMPAYLQSVIQEYRPISLEHGFKNGKTTIPKLQDSNGYIHPGFINTKDNLILGVALHLLKRGENVVFITKDINLRIKAEAIGLETQDYEKEKVDVTDLYRGWQEVGAPTEDINEFYKTKKLHVNPGALQPNEFVILKDNNGGSQSALARYVPSAGGLTPLTKAETTPWGIKPLNTEQRFALELLMRKDIQLVTLVGVPGSGKTLMALAAGLEQTLEDRTYRRMLVARPVIPVGQDIGFLPGSKQEKLDPWMGAIYDNLEFLIDRHHSEESNLDIQMLKDEGKLEIEAVTFLRGRTLPGQYIIIDDAQNLTPHEMKTIISRVGEGSKIVLTGDPYQIDNYYLDAASNGLTNLVEHFKGQPLYGHVTFAKIERSSLAALASELL
jgi:PhoH-like ATPase